MRARLLTVLGGLGALSLLLGAASCSTPVTALICTDAVAIQASSVALNKNETLALTGIIAACNATSGGTVFNNASLATVLINNAILLQGSGLLKDVRILAQAPEAQVTLRKIKAHWEQVPEINRYLVR